MRQYVITVDVYAHWSITPPVYRVFVDNELLTERDFIWPGDEIFIKENIIVDLNPGEHQVRVEKVSGFGNIETKNVTLDGVPSAAEFITTE